MAKAAVLNALNEPLEIRDDVEVESPHAGEIKVRMAASGVCHSDLSVQNGTMGQAMPLVLGHEGAAVVSEVGEGVTGFAPGDHVVLSWVPYCGECYFCAHGQGNLCEKATISLITGGMLDGSKRLTSKGAALGQMSALGTFAQEAVVPAIGAVKIDPDVDLKAAALIGCGVLTGVGAALNTAEIREGDSVAVVGCGGVGLNVIQGARIRNASRIIAIDLNANKLEMAKQFGATDVVNASEADPQQQVAQLTGRRGADVAFEVIGLQRTIDQTIAMTRRGGQAILVGVPRGDVVVTQPAFGGVIFAEKTIKGCWYGSCNVNEDVPKMIELYKSGALKLDELISRTIKLEDVNDAFKAMETGEVARSVIVY